jgi:hypothetical protein
MGPCLSDRAFDVLLRWQGALVLYLDFDGVFDLQRGLASMHWSCENTS